MSIHCNKVYLKPISKSNIPDNEFPIRKSTIDVKDLRDLSSKNYRSLEWNNFELPDIEQTVEIKSRLYHPMTIYSPTALLGLSYANITKDDSEKRFSALHSFVWDYDKSLFYPDCSKYSEKINRRLRSLLGVEHIKINDKGFANFANQRFYQIDQRNMEKHINDLSLIEDKRLNKEKLLLGNRYNKRQEKSRNEIKSNIAKRFSDVHQNLIAENFKPTTKLNLNESWLKNKPKSSTSSNESSDDNLIDIYINAKSFIRNELLSQMKLTPLIQNISNKVSTHKKTTQNLDFKAEESKTLPVDVSLLESYQWCGIVSKALKNP